MKILAHLDFYVPTQRGGSELAIHHALRWLARRGHQVEVLVRRQRARMTYEDVSRGGRNANERSRLWDWCDLAITQHGATGQAVQFAAEHAKPLVFYSHNRGQVAGYPELPDGTLVLFNTAAEAADWPNSMVLHPPVFAEDYRVAPGERVTAVNLCELKGGRVIWDLVDRCPDRRFLAVKGAWQPPGQEQITPRPTPPNAVVLPVVDDMRDVYSQTRVLLMPSFMETFGRVGVEAACSGIPTIAHPTPGLREALGDTPIWVDRDNLDGWADALEQLDDPAEWARRGDAARHRAVDLERQSITQLAELEERLTEHAGALCGA